MPFPGIQFVDGAVYVPDLKLWLDAHEPRGPGERVFISHAHSDHVGDHREVILSEPTARLIQARMTGKRIEHVLSFGKRREFERFHLTLLPAGHIFGSAMGLIESGGESLLYTGDFKLRRGLSAEPCEPRPASILVMETTFGRPQYVFPPANEVIQGILRFCREALDNEETPVLLGYSLGKSQEILCGMAEARIPISVHPSIRDLTEIYQGFGQCFPPFEVYEPGPLSGRVLLCPPQGANSTLMRRLGPRRTAILTGWAVDTNCKYRFQCDAAFPLSDHADFPELLEMVKLVSPRKVYTLHGFAADFAKTLRDLGIDAHALSEHEQLSFTLGDITSPPRKARVVEAVPKGLPTAFAGGGKTRFARFVGTCSAVAATGSKLEKVERIAGFLKELSPEEIILAARWFSGRVFAAVDKPLNLGWAVLRDVLCGVADIDPETFHRVYLKYSDLGETTEEILAGGISQGVTMGQVNAWFTDLQAARGPTAKRPILAQVFGNLGALEAKYLVKILTGDLRIGLKEGLVEEAIAGAFESPAEVVRETNLVVGDIGLTAELARKGELSRAVLVPFRPVKLMLASPESSARDIWERLHPGVGAVQSEVVWIEDKYDGIRCQLHKVSNRAALYSRDLKDITATFPELATLALGFSQDLIMDGEIVAQRGDKVLPFSELQQRLGRKETDLFMQETVPVCMVAFDLLWLEGQTLIKEPLRERRRRLEALIAPGERFRLAQITPATSPAEIDAVFKAARQRGNEGLMVKDPDSVYAPGRRGLSWLKLKQALATLDCVVVGAEYGHGKRSKVLSDYTFAVRDERTSELRVIGKAYSGLTDAEIKQLTGHFLRTAIRQRGRYLEVPPEIVLEIAFDRIQFSDRHPSGLAMRFPRIVRIRTDKPVSEIDTVQAARKLVDSGSA